MPRSLPAFDRHPASFLQVDGAALYRAECRFVVDGDTADFLLDLGLFQYAYEALRFFDVDAPELRGAAPEERQLGMKAKQRVEELLLEQPVLVRIRKGVTFGRFVGEVWFTSDDPAFKDLPNQLTIADARWISIREVLIAERLTKDDVDT